MDNNKYILSEPIQVTEHYWIRQEIGFLGKQWTVYCCFGEFEANHINFVTAPEEKEDAIRMCKMLENARERMKPTPDNDGYMWLLIACAFAWIMMMAIPVIMLT